MQIKEFQALMKEVYWHKDSKRTPEANFIHLVEEVGELGSAIIKGNGKQVKEELADVLAWLVSLANTLSINIEEAAIERYGSCCPKCGGRPCNCNLN
ncbi:MAG: MazG nucleotide pyrophosphohydrolase domain-containing protein [Candidatus Nezhaarchaeota archaeon]|nr:MazG nucleotide pyrophosphohydrolase domain-containing protein [Candidatus Nezhaarchaeota archaeon]